ncbi:MAG: hypothetical protein EBT48_01725 [Verrucomicrobia bacterium]|nr:hypothetical protein [Verrucomicrobiota bacterium]
MPSYFPENNTPIAEDTESRSLQKINDLLQAGITIGEVEIVPGSDPLPITLSGTIGSITSFTNTSSAVLAANNVLRKFLSVFNEGAGILYVLYGTGTASTTNYSVRLQPGDYLEVDKYTGQVTAIFGSAGTARVSTVTG